MREEFCNLLAMSAVDTVWESGNNMLCICHPVTRDRKGVALDNSFLELFSPLGSPFTCSRILSCSEYEGADVVIQDSLSHP